MKQQILLQSCLILFAVNAVGAQDELPSPPEATLIEGEPLLRGPIHEAYAEPLEAEEFEPLVSPVAPPETIEEVPPEAAPAGERVAWIPGYWAWDDERRDYIWISGVYRQSPPGRTWVAGEWVAIDGGYQWSPGYWAADGALTVERVPSPPPSLDHGPVSPAPSDDHFWIPGCWQYRAQRYAWRPGFWSACHDNWVWVPDHYVYGPTGCVYVHGYWDYAWESRGVLYSPCYFDRQVVYRPGCYYRPSVVVDVSGAFFHLWVRPNYCHYYYGDYYDRGYLGVGYLPWHQYHYHRGHGYDPLFVHSQWRFRRDRVDLYRHLENRHRHLALQTQARPARQLASTPRGAVRRNHDVLTRHVKEQVSDANLRRQQIRENVLTAHRDQLRNGLADNQVPPRADQAIGNRQRVGRDNPQGSGARANDRSLSTRSRPNRTHNARGSEFASDLIQRRSNVEPTNAENRGVLSRRDDASSSQDVRPVPRSRDRARSLASSSSTNTPATKQDAAKNGTQVLTEAEARNAIRRQFMARNQANAQADNQKSAVSNTRRTEAVTQTQPNAEPRDNRRNTSINTRSNVRAEARTNAASNTPLNTRKNVRTNPPTTNASSSARSVTPANSVRRNANNNPVPQTPPRSQTQRREELRARMNTPRRNIDPRASASSIGPTFGNSANPRGVVGSTPSPAGGGVGRTARTVSKPAVQLPARQLPAARPPAARPPAARPPAARTPAARTPARQVSGFPARRSSAPPAVQRRSVPSVNRGSNVQRQAVSGAMHRRSMNVGTRGGGGRKN